MSPRFAELRVRVRARFARARAEGVATTAFCVADAFASSFVWLLLLPVTVVLHVAGVRRLTVLTGRIGHLAAEPDAFLKARALGEIPPGRYFIAAPRRAVANPTMLDYWRPHLRVIESPPACWIARAMSRHLLMRHDMSRYALKLNASQEMYRINAAWHGRPPLLSVTETDRAWSDERLRELGIPEQAWFVCVHVREPGFSPADEAVHAHRNATPANMLPAMREIVRRGGWCVRMGDPTMTALAPMSGLIDYAHHRLRSARLDVLLCARARFFLGCTSGLSFVSASFGVPCALANMIPTSVVAPMPADLAIPKLLRERGSGRLLAFAEVLGSPMGDWRYAHLFAAAGVEPVENSADEILGLVGEMLDRLEGRHRDADGDDDRQRRFMALLRPGHYGYGAASRIGADFLRRHESLLPGR
jgi:putative glycosyltransferase (TIGR04372 family)